MTIKERILRVLFFISMFTWALPWTIISSIISLFIYIIVHKRITNKFTFKGRLVIYVEWNTGSINLGFFNFLNHNMDDDFTLYHELGHSIQSAIYGPLFPFIVGIPSILRAAFWNRWFYYNYIKHGIIKDYNAIWFESQATNLGYKFLNK